MDELPDLPLLQVLSYLSPDDLRALSVQCTRLWHATRADALWAPHCREWFDCGVERVAGTASWFESWRRCQTQFWRYGPVYGRMKRALATIEGAFVAAGLDPRLLPGLSEHELDALAAVAPARTMPLEMRCHLRLCSGQAWDLAGPAFLFGQCSFYDVMRARVPLPHEAVRACLDQGVFAVAAERGQPSVVMVINPTSGEVSVREWVVAPSWLVYLEGLAGRLHRRELVVTRERGLSLFAVSNIPTAVTRGIVVTASPLLIESQSNEEQSLVAYEVRISATATAPRCKLVSRRWIIDASGDDEPEVVEGPGVIGLHPDVYPGMPVFSYASCCHLRAQRGTMGGHFTMRHADSGELFTIAVPTFPLVRAQLVMELRNE